MTRFILIIILLFTSFVAFGSWSDSLIGYADREYRSPTAIVGDEESGLVYVAQATANRIAVLDARSETVVREFDLPDPASDLLLDGSTLIATSISPQGAVYELDVTSGEISRTIPAGHMPRSPVLSPDGETLYVLNRFENVVSFMDRESGEVLTRVRTPREPIDAVLTSDGRTLIVLNHLPTEPATADLIAAEISFIDTQSQQVTASVKLPSGSTSARQICLSADGKYAFCTHILARFRNPTTQLVRGWMNTNAFSIIDVTERQHYATVLLDDVDLGAANPWAIAINEDGGLLAVTHAGLHEVSLIDMPALMKTLDAMDDQARANASTHLSFLTGMRERIALRGRAPRDAVFLGSSLFVAEYFSDSVSVVDLNEASASRLENSSVRAIAIGDTTEPTDPVRRGAMIFSDADMCFQGWQSCESCHPDTRTDALNWDLLNDGFGNPKNTKNLLHAHQTPPAMITGIRASAEVAVRAGVRYIQFAHRPEEDLEAIDAYLSAMQPVPSPYLVDGELSPAAERGRDIFHNKAECINCHSGQYFTDQEKHLLGFAIGQDKDKPMDTPTLIEVWRTAPYLHDGRAADMHSLFKMHNPFDKHGKTSELTDEELNDLIEYVLSL